jgi:alkylhydroperoxidase family enzyme
VWGKSYGEQGNEKAGTKGTRERAALAWTEAITNIQDGHAEDEVYEAARKEFSEAELEGLTLAITQINTWNRTWNRISIGFRVEAGTYQPAKRS